MSLLVCTPYSYVKVNLFLSDVIVSPFDCKESFSDFCVVTDHLCNLFLFVVQGLDQLLVFAVICNPIPASKLFSPLGGSIPSCVACLSFLLALLGFLDCLSGRRSCQAQLFCRVAWSGCMSSARLCCRLVSVGSRGTIRGTIGSMSTS